MSDSDVQLLISKLPDECLAHKLVSLLIGHPQTEWKTVIDAHLTELVATGAKAPRDAKN